jgi:hypothetical protein
MLTDEVDKLELDIVMKELYAAQSIIANLNAIIMLKDKLIEMLSEELRNRK